MNQDMKPIGNLKRHTEERPDSVVRGNIADELPKTLEDDPLIAKKEFDLEVRADDN